MEALKESDGNFIVYIHPSKANKITQAIIRQISSLLFQYNQVFDGVLLGYDVIETENQVANILPGIHPFFGVRLRTKLLLFKPMPNMLLEGKVLKISPQSIHIVVLGFVSAVIAEEDIPENFKYRVKKHGKELFVSKSDKLHRIKAGTFVRFNVKSFDKEILHIAGSLISENTGNIRWLNKNSGELSHSNRKRKEEKWETVEEESSVPTFDAPTNSSTERRHKKSKNR
ncbi:uncharacterized protein LOC124927243 [Impatiens glandulifera]|uniref:uncharacterized protein LOC124927243 n=1 Tax=Impatiens glandulifera TaxID=253017 RepID=UPI001FB11129|nr:uncharacterized protein LOC124927243 [Impatiens glandulifera]